MRWAGKRSRTGCVTCRRRHYKCDETRPTCQKCQRVGLICEWKTGLSQDSGDDILYSSDGALSSGENQAGHPVDQDGLLLKSTLLLTSGSDSIGYFISSFYDFTLDLCNWTNLIELPKRSTVPSILVGNSRHTRGMTNWANYLLPSLALCSIDDPLSLSMAAYTALRIGRRNFAIIYYIRVIRRLRNILSQKDADMMGNQEFLRIWATTLILAEFESVSRHPLEQAQHICGATTMALIASRRFPIAATRRSTASSARAENTTITAGVNATSVSPKSSTNALHISQPKAAVHSDPNYSNNNAIPPSPAKVSSMSERELPGYLLDLTRLRRYASKSAKTIDVVWPRFWRPSSTLQTCQTLLDMAAAAYSHVMPLIQDFYTTLSDWRSLPSEEIVKSLQAYRLRYDLARALIDKYKRILSGLTGPEFDIQQSCAEPDCPFSPIIEFVNPQMAQINAIPEVYMCLLAPFVSDAEHEASVNHVSSIYAYLQKVPGLQRGCIMPDLFIAAFWKAGAERDYFRNGLARKNHDFSNCIEQVWSTIDGVSSSEQRAVSRVEILGITLEAGRSVQEQGFKLRSKPFWQDVGMLSEAWAVAVGAPDPLTSAYTTEAEKQRRAAYADVSLFHYRLSIFRQTDCKHTGAAEKYMSQLKAPTKNEGPMTRLQNRVYDPCSVNVSDPYSAFAPDQLDVSELFKQELTQVDLTTEAGQIACHIWKNDPDKSRIYYII